MSVEKSEISVHAARTALNRDPEVRAWAEAWVKERERAAFAAEHPEASAEEYEKHWRYVRPERMHEGAVAAVTAYYAQEDAPTENDDVVGR